MSQSLDIDFDSRQKPAGISGKFHRYLLKKQKFARPVKPGTLYKTLSNPSTEDDTFSRTSSGISSSRTSSSGISSSSSSGSSSETLDESEPWTAMDWAILFVKAMVYVTLQTIAVLEQFGAVFFMLFLFYLMWVGLSDKKRKPDQLSAYSVFNPNFEQIEGTVNAQKLQAELTFGAIH